ncbi:LPS export ABC transporter periplasmic protein LptC [Limnohabitans sp. DCL3]|uniref:LPS export ABC transporter periplasmic protein LptC n=1 Tax=Limnohabitans sp. DCL3 TaxID=3374103 RepID=UPI003A8B1271
MKLRRLLDALSVYLPLIVMALLASGSWWLVRSAPTMVYPESDPPLRQDPDYRLSDFSVKSFNQNGQMVRELSGKTAQHFPATKALHIEKIRIFAQNESGDRLLAQAQQGIARDDGTQVTLLGGAQAIQRPQANRPPIELRGDRLIALPDEDQVVSDDPVRITRGADIFTANTMSFNSRTGAYTLQGRVRGSLAAKSAQP